MHKKKAIFFNSKMKKCQSYLNNDHDKQVGANKPILPKLPCLNGKHSLNLLKNKSLIQKSANFGSQAITNAGTLAQRAEGGYHSLPCLRLLPCRATVAGKMHQLIQDNFFNSKTQSPLYLSSKNSAASNFCLIASFAPLAVPSRQLQFQRSSKSSKSSSFVNEKGKKYYTSYSKLSEVKLLTIGIASPLRILQWAEKTLPNGKIYGEVLNANTLHHKTFKPQKGGLFCERIFGPLKDFECACGKTDKSIKKMQKNSQSELSNSISQQKENYFSKTNSASSVDSEVPKESATVKPKVAARALAVARSNHNRTEHSNQTTNQNFKVVRKFCPDCDVEYTWSVIRRYQIGYIKLSSPITHIWFLKGTPSYLSLLLDMKKRYLQFVTYCSETLTIEKSYLPFYSSQDSSLTASLATSLPTVACPLGRSTVDSVEQHRTEGRLVASSILNSQSDKKYKKFVCVAKKGWHFDKNRIKEQLDSRVSSIPFDEVPATLATEQGVQKKELFETKLHYFKAKKLLIPFSSALSEKMKEKCQNGLMPFVITPKKDFISDNAFSKFSNTKNKTTNNETIRTNKSKNQMFFVSILLLKIYSKYFENVSMRYSDFNLINKKSSIFSSNKTSFYENNPSYIGLDNLKLKDNFSNIEPFPSKRDSFLGFKGETSQPNNLFESIIFKQKSVKVLNLKRTFQKLPLDLYILSSLEIMLQKSSLYLSIQTAWEILYKKSFLKALKKTKTIILPASVLPYFLCCLLALPPVGKKQEDSFACDCCPALLPGLPAKLGTTLLCLATSGSTAGHSKGPCCAQQGNSRQAGSLTTAKEDLNSKIELFVKHLIHQLNINLKNENTLKLNEIQMNTLILKNLKIKYTKHILKSLKKLKALSLSVYNTTTFSRKNTFLTIQKKSSYEMIKLFLKNTQFYEKMLSEFFIYSILIDKFLSLYENKYKIQSKLYKHLLPSGARLLWQTFVASNCQTEGSSNCQTEGSSKGLLRTGGSCGKATDKLPEVATAQATVKQKDVSVSSIFNGKNLTKNKKTKSLSTLKTYKKMLMVMNIPKYELLNLSNSSNFSEIIDSLNSKKGLNAVGATSSQQQGLLRTEGKLTGKSEGRTPATVALLGTARGVSNTFKNKIYNNVYTLSHRERWDIDKDWYIFSLFTFGVTDFFDYPISTYKNRLFSLPYSFENVTLNMKFAPALANREQEAIDKSSSSNFSENWNLPFPIQNPNLESKKINMNENLHLNNTKLSASFLNSSSFYSGAGIVQQLLNEFDLNEIQKLDKQNRLLLYQINKSILKYKKIVQIFVYDKTSQLKLKELCKKRDLLIRRTKLVRKMYRKNTSPSSMVLTILPVLPPDLRPIIKMGSQIAASDLNRLYQRVIYRNDRLKKFLKDPATSQSYEMKYAQRLLQEAVDNLIQNGKSGPNSEKDARGRALKSLSDILKGKQGRFRQFLLGKRVDYSGRSVIVVGPKLKLHECGLPLEMAKELYLPFLLKSILNKNYAKTVIGAKTLIQNNPALANELLHEIMQITPILLNRAPTLHRLGIQAFVPKLIEGRAILLHPLVCSAFNADFDGDQMAVHVPITIEARAEAWKLMLSRNNLLAPATGEPLAIPSQDMVLGCYYLTTFSKKSKLLRGSGMYFNTLYDVIKLYEEQLIDIHSFVWVKWMNLIENGTDQESPLEIRISTSGQWKEVTSNYQRTFNSNNVLVNVYMCTTPGRILFNSLIQQLIV
jgi:DNA-directed RNA polymerase beta' subunit